MEHHERIQLYGLFDLGDIEDVDDGAGFFIHHWSRSMYILPSSHTLDRMSFSALLAFLFLLTIADNP